MNVLCYYSFKRILQLSIVACRGLLILGRVLKCVLVKFQILVAKRKAAYLKDSAR